MFKRLVYFFSFMMLFNTTYGMTWAHACINNLNKSESISSYSVEQEASVDLSMMPCHQVVQEDIQLNCDSSCFCSFMAMSSIVYFNIDNGIHIRPTSTQIFRIENLILVSIHDMPVEHPPKIHA